MILFLVGLSAAGCQKPKVKTQQQDIIAQQPVIANVTYSDNNPLLKNANDTVMIGTAINASNFNNPTCTNLAGNQYNSLTAKNDMKFAALEPSRNGFTYNTDVVLFAQNHGIHRVHGHNYTRKYAYQCFYERLNQNITIQ